jgi:hypothetical protein
MMTMTVFFWNCTMQNQGAMSLQKVEYLITRSYDGKYVKREFWSASIGSKIQTYVPRFNKWSNKVFKV